MCGRGFCAYGVCSVQQVTMKEDLVRSCGRYRWTYWEAVPVGEAREEEEKYEEVATR